MYGVSLSLRPHTESRHYVYTTWPQELVRIYDERSFIEIDPRIHDVTGSVLPRLWDQSTYRGRTPALDAFLDIFQVHSIGSGIICPIRDRHGRMAVLSLSSNSHKNDDVRNSTIANDIGNIVLFGLYFHELFINAVINELVPPHLLGTKLSNRERPCLNMAAHGLSGEDIALKLSISLRTTQHHFDSIRSKLGAANRLEAVAMALATGIITF